MNRSQLVTKRAMKLIICVFAASLQSIAQSNQIPVDWPTRSAACGPKPTQSTSQQFKVSGINDLPFVFKNGVRPQYVLKVDSTPASEVPPADFLALFLGQQSAAQKAITRSAEQNRVPVPQCPASSGQLAAALAALRASDLEIPAVSSNNNAASLQESQSLSQSLISSNTALSLLQQVFSDSSCSTVLQQFLSDPILQWVSRVNSPDHSAIFSVSVNPNTNYKFDLSEIWQGVTLKNATLTWRCGDTDIFTLSVGPMFTTLPYRTYGHQKAPVPPGGSTTQDILSVNESTNVLGAALLNIHFPQIPHVPEWLGPAISLGPVYAFGSAPSVTKLGFFTGASLHLYRSAFLTAGVHIGQFADYPVNLTKGSVIPNGFGDLNPVTRNTVRFAIGITFKTNTLKSSSQGAAPTNPGQPAAAQPTPAAAPAAQAAPIPVVQSTPAPTPPTPVVQPSAQAKWTILVFMNAKNNLEQDAFKNYWQMAQVGSSKDVNVVVELGRPQKHYYTADSAPWSGVKRFIVAKGVVTPDAANAVEDLGAADMGKGSTMSEFVSWGVPKFPAVNYMLVIWDHGQGYRFQIAMDRRNREFASLRSLALDGGRAPEQPNSPILGGIKSVSYDEDTGNILYNRDIEDSLKGALASDGLKKYIASGKISVLGFDACLMSMLETSYAMRDVSEFFVGSEEEEPGDGWDYEKFLSPLSQNPSLSAADVSKLVVQGYQATYGGRPSQTTMSALDQSKIKAVSDAVGDFAVAAGPLLQANIQTFRQTRSKVKSYGASSPTKVSVDLMYFTKQLGLAFPRSSLGDKAAAIEKALTPAILLSYSSPDMLDGYGTSGLAIFFPASAKDFQADPNSSGYDPANTLFPIEFVKEVPWSTFVSSYVQIEQNSPRIARIPASKSKKPMAN
jgi:hypothetical protein